MDERPLDPARVYLLKHTTRTVTAEVSHALLLNQIGTVTVSTARPLVFDAYEANRTTGSLILIDPATQFTAGAGMIVAAAREGAIGGPAAPVSAAERLALTARHAASDAEAIDAVRRALEEMLR
jgi:sulfate adenylyltransferase subunit 1 (EFTu-like GTPase family)